MSATEPRPLRADARRNRERIVDAARVVFAASGQTAQMDDVARLAGVGVGTVYRHFPTKSSLIGEILRAKFRGNVEIARRWSEQAEGFAALEGMMREIFARMAEDAAQQRMMWTTDDAALALAEVERRELVEVVGAMIDVAHERGELRRDFGVQDMPLVMCAMGSVMSVDVAFAARFGTLADTIIDGLRVR